MQTQTVLGGTDFCTQYSVQLRLDSARAGQAAMREARTGHARDVHRGTLAEECVAQVALSGRPQGLAGGLG